MILNRLGNKKRLAGLIIPLFPKHDIYIEPFFGAGSIFFLKPKAKHNFLNDLDLEVYNFWKVTREQKDAFIEEFSRLPIHQQIFNEWKTEIPKDEVLRAVRFVFLSNFSYLGMGDTIHLQPQNQKKAILKKIDATLKIVGDNIYFTNENYYKMLSNISFRGGEIEKDKAFIYCDPPYVETKNNYNTPKWGLDDFEGLLDFLLGYGANFAVSEYSNPKVIEACKKRNLNVHILKEIQGLKSRSVEILITNYQTNQLKLF